jgi:hypothetical protein
MTLAGTEGEDRWRCMMVTGRAGDNALSISDRGKGKGKEGGGLGQLWWRQENGGGPRARKEKKCGPLGILMSYCKRREAWLE